MRKMMAVAIAMLLFPWLVSLAWSGTVKGTVKGTVEDTQAVEVGNEVVVGEGPSSDEPISGNTETGERRILVERNGIQTYITLEDYLPGVIVCQISQEYRLEALKCQAVIARSYIYRLMDGRTEIWEEELDLDYLSENQRNAPWDGEKTAQYLGQCRQAVADTAGVVMQYEGRDILPLFHAVSAGRTRKGDENYPYLQSVESRWDTEREDYLQTEEWGLPEFAELINGIPDGAGVTQEQLPSQIQTVKKDDAGYLVQMKIGSKTYTGEEIQYALGLPSACFTLEGSSEEIRAVTKGIGHGFGLSQAGADAMAGEGWGYADILNYYYKNISLISE